MLEKKRSGEEKQIGVYLKKINFFKSEINILAEFYFLRFYTHLNHTTNLYFIPL